jgi:hypothetical protein
MNGWLIRETLRRYGMDYSWEKIKITGVKKTNSELAPLSQEMYVHRLLAIGMDSASAQEDDSLRPANCMTGSGCCFQSLTAPIIVLHKLYGLPEIKREENLLRISTSIAYLACRFRHGSVIYINKKKSFFIAGN